MLICEGYKMFEGTMRLLTRLPGTNDILYTGTWFYKPEKRMWYVNNCTAFPFGGSFPEDRVQFVSEVKR